MYKLINTSREIQKDFPTFPHKDDCMHKHMHTEERLTAVIYSNKETLWGIWKNLHMHRGTHMLPC